MTKESICAGVTKQSIKEMKSKPPSIGFNSAVCFYSQFPSDVLEISE